MVFFKFFYSFPDLYGRLIHLQRRKQSLSLLSKFWLTLPGWFQHRRSSLNFLRTADMCLWSQHHQGLFSWGTCVPMNQRYYPSQMLHRLHSHLLVVGQQRDSRVLLRPWLLMKNLSHQLLSSTPHDSASVWFSSSVLGVEVLRAEETNKLVWLTAATILLGEMSNKGWISRHFAGSLISWNCKLF